MTNKDFLIKYPLQFSHPEESAKKLREIIKKANESYPLEVEETIGVKVGTVQYYDFNIYCTTTFFASAYFHFGLLYTEYVLPVWNAQFTKTK